MMSFGVGTGGGILVNCWAHWETGPNSTTPKIHQSLTLCLFTVCRAVVFGITLLKKVKMNLKKKRRKRKGKLLRNHKGK